MTGRALCVAPVFFKMVIICKHFVHELKHLTIGIACIDMIPNIALKAVVIEQLVYCENKERGCEITMTVESLPNHLVICDYQPHICDNQQFGCSVTGSMENT
jgi:hypothetical protein